MLYLPKKKKIYTASQTVAFVHSTLQKVLLDLRVQLQLATAILEDVLEVAPAIQRLRTIGALLAFLDTS